MTYIGAIKKLSAISLSAALLIGLAGCNSLPFKQTEKPPVAKEYKPLSVDEKIANAAESVSTSLRSLSRAEQADNPQASAGPSVAPEGLRTKLNVTWSGPIHQFMLNAMKHTDSYSLTIRGKEPAIPVIVTVDRKNVTLYEIIRDVAIQCGARANVVIDVTDPRNKQVILEYSA